MTAPSCVWSIKSSLTLGTNEFRTFTLNRKVASAKPGYDFVSMGGVLNTCKSRPFIDARLCRDSKSWPGWTLQNGASLRMVKLNSNSAIAPSLGRNLSNSAPSATINLIEPGTLYGDRVNEIDVRFAKIIRVMGTRTNIGVDVYNIINSSAVLTYNQNFIPGGSWLTPNSVLQPRFLKIGATIDF